MQVSLVPVHLVPESTLGESIQHAPLYEEIKVSLQVPAWALLCVLWLPFWATVSAWCCLLCH